MKYLHIITLMLFLSAPLGIHAQQVPSWIKQMPRPDNNTYLYVCEQGIGANLQVAYNIAMTRVFQNTANRIGQPFDSQKLSEALQGGTSLEVISRTYNIPINKVCEYPEHLADGTYRVYVLCQVAVAGNIQPQWTPFAKCFSTGDDGGGMALLKSIFVPGLGQMGKGYIAEGVLTLTGEILLVGGAAGCYFISQDKLATMRDAQVSYTDFTSAQQTYNTCRTTSYILWGGAAALYAFNLIRAATATPRHRDGLALAPSLLPTTAGLTPGLSLTLSM